MVEMDVGHGNPIESRRAADGGQRLEQNIQRRRRAGFNQSVVTVGFNQECRDDARDTLKPEVEDDQSGNPTVGAAEALNNLVAFALDFAELRLGDQPCEVIPHFAGTFARHNVGQDWPEIGAPISVHLNGGDSKGPLRHT